MTGRLEHQVICVFVCITILSSFSDCGYCPASVPTVSVVSKCPTNKTEWDEAASRKKCSHMSAKCGDKSPVYHCLLNQWRNETVEVCASTWYISGFCAVYNTDEMKVIDDFKIDCTKFSEDKCPTRYISSDAYLYQSCYMQKSYTEKPIPDKRTKETNDCIMSTVIAVIVTVLVLVIVALLVIIKCRFKISKKEPDEKCMPFCYTNEPVKKIEDARELLLNQSTENSERRETADTSGVECSNLPGVHVLPAEYETADTSGVECSNLPGVQFLQEKYGGGKTRVQTPNERVTNSSYAKPKDKENGTQKGTFLKELELKVEHTTENDVNFISRGNLDNLDNKEDIDIDVKQKAGHTIQNDVDCSSHGNLINEEKNDDEREKSPDPSPSDYDSAVDTENVAQNVSSEVDQKVDHVDFPSVCNSTKEDEYEDEKTQSPDSTSRESVTNTMNATSTDSDTSETEKSLGNEDSDAAETEKSLRNEEKIESPDRSSKDEVHRSVDINEGGVDVRSAGRVQFLTENLEKRTREGGIFQTPNARTTRSSFRNT